MTADGHKLRSPRHDPRRPSAPGLGILLDDFHHRRHPPVRQAIEETRQVVESGGARGNAAEPLGDLEKVGGIDIDPDGLLYGTTPAA